MSPPQTNSIQQRSTKGVAARIYKCLHETLSQATPAPGSLLTITLPSPELAITTPPPLKNEEWLFWGHPQEKRYRLGLGSALLVESEGAQRLDKLSSQLRQQTSRWLHLDPEQCGMEPASFCGFAFDPDAPMTDEWEALPNSALFFPELLVSHTRPHCCVSFSWQVTADSELTPLARWMDLLNHLLSGLSEPMASGASKPIMRTEDQGQLEWTKLIQRATRSIHQKNLEKVVPSRKIKVKLPRQPTPDLLIENLQTQHPGCRLFAIARRGCLFLSVSPERLASRQGNKLACDAVGGTLPRGRDRSSDDNLKSLLRSNPKISHEHELVVSSITDRLHPLCGDLIAPAEPGVMGLPRVQHLKTEIHGRLTSDIGLLDVANQLHPTAAVNGTPTNQAKSWLKQHETHERGWYTGAAGWIDRKGDGELDVMLRCALIQGDQAVLHAGAGITTGSNPEEEWLETELKLATMLDALGQS